MTIVTRILIGNAKSIDNNEFYRYVILLRFKGVIAEDENNILMCDREFSTHQENLLKINNNKIVHHGFYSGHYFDNLADAIEDFRKRNKQDGIEIEKNL